MTQDLERYLNGKPVEAVATPRSQRDGSHRPARTPPSDSPAEAAAAATVARPSRPGIHESPIARLIIKHRADIRLVSRRPRAFRLSSHRPRSIRHPQEAARSPAGTAVGPNDHRPRLGQVVRAAQIRVGPAPSLRRCRTPSKGSCWTKAASPSSTIARTSRPRPSPTGSERRTTCAVFCSSIPRNKIARGRELICEGQIARIRARYVVHGRVYLQSRNCSARPSDTSSRPPN